MRKKMGFFLVILASLFLSRISFAEAANKYVGVEKCKLCHKSEDKGNQYGEWKSSKHASAYKSLGSTKAKEYAAKAGLTDDPQKSEKCLKCHATAFGVTPDMIEEESELKIEDGVQCETCHGAGEKYWKIDTMRSQSASVANGLLIPKETNCVKCHNSESPAWSGSFNYEEDRKKILHPRPKSTE